MSASELFMGGLDRSTAEIIASGYLRDILGGDHSPTDITGLCIQYFYSVIFWKIPIHQITTTLNRDLTTLNGPEFEIDHHKFVLKAKRSRNNLYFGVWYQPNIQRELYSHFQSSFNPQIANKIIESFNFIINRRQFDNVQLILHDMSDIAYSCILEHIESTLRSSPLLAAYKNVNLSINNIKQNIIRILSLFNPDSGPQATSLMFRMRLYCPEIGREFKRLYQFHTNEVCERGAEMNWRSKHNNYEDHRLGFDDIIKDKEYLGLDCYLELIDDTDKTRYDRHQNDSYHYRLGQQQIKKLINMDNGDNLYLNPVNGRFAVFIEANHGRRYVFLQQLYPNKDNTDNIMETTIKSIQFNINDMPNHTPFYGKFSEDEDTVWIGMFGTSVLARTDEEEYKPLILSVDFEYM